MTRLTTYIQQHLSLRLGLLILLVVGGVFCVSLSYLFYESKRQGTEEAVHRATQALDETVRHISSIMDKAEENTKEMEALIRNISNPTRCWPTPVGCWNSTPTSWGSLSP